MMLKKIVLAIVIGIFLIIFVSHSFSANGWTIQGNNVTIDDSKVYISVFPHTLTTTGSVEISLKSKVYSGDVDIVFGFDTDKVKPTDAFYYNPKWRNTTESYTCNDNQVNYTMTFNYTLSPKYAWCYEVITNNITGVNTTNLIFSHSFETGNLSTRTIYWNEPHLDEWQEINSFESLNYNFQGMNKWYYLKNINIEQNKNYRMKLNLYIPFNSGKQNGKYWVAIKPSSETIQQAIANNHLYYLDPWYSYNLVKKRMVNISQASFYDIENYSKLIEVTYDPDMQPDFDDIVFVNSTEDGLIDYWIRNFTLSTKADVYLSIPNVSKSRETIIYMYYGNLTASNTSSQGVVCPAGIVNGECALFFDNFTAQLNTSVWVGNPSAYAVNITDNFLFVNVTLSAIDRVIMTSKNYTGSLKLSTRMRQTTSGDHFGTVGFNYNFTNLNVIYTGNTPVFTYFDVHNGTNNVLYRTGDSYQDNTFRDFKLAKIANNFTAFFNNTIINSSTIPNALWNGSIRILGREDNVANWDYVLLSKYTPVEPTYSIGAETSYDLLNPNITIKSPLNTTYSISRLDFNITANENLSWCNFTLSNWTINLSMSSFNSTYFNFTNSSIPDGQYTAKFNCSDTAWNINDSEQVTFVVDTRAPNLTIDSPLNITYGSKSVLINLTNSSDAIYVWFFNGTENVTYSKPLLHNFTDGSHTIIAYANDSVNNVNQTQITFIIDTIPPNLTIKSPGNITYSTRKIDFNITSNENLSSCNFTINNWGNRFIMTSFNSTYYNYTNSSVLDGQYTAKFNCSDLVGNTNSSESITFFVDASPPVVSLVSPENNSGSPNSNVTFVYSVTDASLVANCSLTINNKVNQTNSSVVKNINSTFNVVNVPLGFDYNWTVNCTDNATNMGFTHSLYFRTILLTEFTGNTTNLTEVDIKNVTNFTLENPAYSTIVFTVPVDLSNATSIDLVANISIDTVEINSTALPNLNVSAEISFYNIHFANPRITKDGTICTPPDCTERNYTNNVYTFNVTGFSSYKVEETPSSSGQGGGGGTTVQTIKAYALIRSLNETRFDYTDRQRAMIYAVIKSYTDLYGVPDSLSENQSNELLSIFLNKDLTLTKLQLDMWFTQFKNNQVEEVEVTLEDLNKLSLIKIATVEVLQLTLNPARLATVWFYPYPNKKFTWNVKTNQNIKLCEITTKNIEGLECKLIDNSTLEISAYADRISELYTSIEGEARVESDIGSISRLPINIKVYNVSYNVLGAIPLLMLIPLVLIAGIATFYQIKRGKKKNVE